jgi:hypothetical protein
MQAIHSTFTSENLNASTPFSLPLTPRNNKEKPHEFVFSFTCNHHSWSHVASKQQLQFSLSDQSATESTLPSEYLHMI